jgi:hypothetical protein
MESPSFDLVAASLRADARDLKAFVEALAEKLTGSFPGLVQIERRGGFLRGPKPVRRIVVSFGDDRFTLDHDNGAVACQRSAMVRGVALRNEQLGVDAWIEELSRSLVKQAEASEQGREALGRLLT